MGTELREMELISSGNQAESVITSHSQEEIQNFNRHS